MSITNLFKSVYLIPTNNMTINEQLNSFIRLIILITIILMFLDIRLSFLFLVICVGVIFYVYKNKKMYSENFKNNINKEMDIKKYYNSLTNTSNNGVQIVYNVQDITNGKYKAINVDSNNKVDTEVYTRNQRLAGNCNPKTKISPVVIPPAFASDFWSTNDLVSFPQINTSVQEDNYLSGYEVLTNNCEKEVKCEEKKCDKVMSKDTNYISKKIGNIKENFNRGNNIVENYDSKIEYPYINLKDNNIGYVLPNESGWVNTSCGYNPEQIYKSNIPSNLTVGKCDLDKNMSDYNKDIFTQTIQPGVYTTNQVNEPINSNIGISYNQQFEPTTYKFDSCGNMYYTEHDPRIIDPDLIKEEVKDEEGVTTYNVYDPRFNGYGTSYRSYLDNNTGQTRFMYDDINAVRMPNYITRSNIDFEKYADTYGPIQNEKGIGLSETRNKTQKQWTDNSVQFRNELQQRLMRKRNSEMWQLRKYPIHK